MSMLHDFVLIDRPQLAAGEAFPVDDPTSVRIHHELMEYIRASLALIPVYGAWHGDVPREIDLFGVSVIRSDGAALAAGIFSAWADLLAAGPPQIELTGGLFEWIGQDDEDEDEASAATADPTAADPASTEDEDEAEPDDESEQDRTATDDESEQDEVAADDETPAYEPDPESEDDDDDWPPIIDRPAIHKVHATSVPVPGDTGLCRFEIDRDQAVAALRLLAEWSDQIAAGDGRFLLHGGL